MTTVAELPARYAEKVIAAQSVFRAVMDAMARPGSTHRIGSVAGAFPEPMMRGTASIAMTLFDHDTPIWLDAAMAQTRDVGKWLKFHTSAPVVEDASVASFALIGDPPLLPPLDHFAFGSNEYPDRSTTVILQVASLASGIELELCGPGIDGVTPLRVALQPADLVARLAINQALFPRGIDIVLVADDMIAAIPRTTRIVVRET